MVRLCQVLKLESNVLHTKIIKVLKLITPNVVYQQISEKKKITEFLNGLLYRRVNDLPDGTSLSIALELTQQQTSCFRKLSTLAKLVFNVSCSVMKTGSYRD